MPNRSILPPLIACVCFALLLATGTHATPDGDQVSLAWTLQPGDLAVYRVTFKRNKDGVESHPTDTLLAFYGGQLGADGKILDSKLFAQCNPGRLRVRDGVSPAPLLALFRTPVVKTFIDKKVNLSKVLDDDLAAARQSSMSLTVTKQDDDAYYYEGEMEATLAWHIGDKGKPAVAPVSLQYSAVFSKQGYLQSAAFRNATLPRTDRMIDGIEGEITLLYLLNDGATAPQEWITRAVQRGVAYLRAAQNPNGAFPIVSDGRDTGLAGDFDDAGSTALALFALVKSGVKPADPVVTKGWKYLQSYDPMKGDESYTPSLICLLSLAMDDALAAQASGNEADTAELKKQLDAAVEKSAKALLANYETNKKTGFAYSPVEARAEGTDMSNTQFSILGLMAAHKYGRAIDTPVWKNLLELHIDNMVGDGNFRILEFELQDNDAEARWGRLMKLGRARILGWTYGVTPEARGKLNFNQPYFSMTWGGLGSVAGIRGLLRDAGELTDEEDDAACQAVANAIAFLQHDWQTEYFRRGTLSKTVNPMPGYLFYSLYTLEKGATLAQLATIGGRSWFHDAALTILTRQESDGRWAEARMDVPDTAFALLFLAQSTRNLAPVPTGPGPK